MRMLRHPVAVAVTSLITATLSHAAFAADALPMCPEERMFGEEVWVTDRAPSPLRPAIELKDGVVIDSNGPFRADAEGRLRLSERVTIREGERTLTADELHVDSESNNFEVRGRVEYRDPDLVVRGDDGDFADGEASINGAHFELPKQPARGEARKLSLDREGQLRLEGVSYTSCPIDRSDWAIEAGSVEINTRTQTGVARDARLRFLGVPIIRLPWLSFPVGGARKSGFLFPSIGSSSRGGLQFSVPYYLNLAPNLDASITPTGFTRRGIDLGSEVRYLLAHSRGRLTSNLLPSDGLTGDSRSRIRLENVSELAGNWRLTLDAENVSDAQYFEDFSQGADGASIAFLPRVAHLSWRDPNLRLGVLARNFQTIDQALLPIDRPYTEVPRAYAEGLWQLGDVMPVEYGFESEATGFRRSIGVEGWRFNAKPQVGLRVEGAGYFLRPSLAFQTTQYELRDTAPGVDRSQSRSLPIASLDGGLLFERGVGSSGNRRLTFEPRLMYLHVPYRNQDDLPVFDTGEPDLNWVELFRTNRYVGLDRIGDANQLSVGFTTRLFDTASGTRYLSATLGQTVYFDPPRVRLPDEPVATRHASDLIAELELKAFEDWNVNMGMQWNPDDSRAERSEVRLQYRPNGSRVINAGYRFQRDRMEQADFSAAWPVNNEWNVYGRVLYSMRDRESIETFAGFEYSGCCWGLRAVVREYVSRRSGERDRGIYLQLELKGLSNVGLAADAFLERAIRGYSPNGRRR